VSSGDCVFCKIISGEIPSVPLYEDDDVYAFSDINPQAPTHILIVPKKHIPSVRSLGDADTAIAGRLIVTAARLSEANGIAGSGFRLVVNAGIDGGQSVDHLHLHLLGGRRLGWPPG
jgi:histidine triad (HIT) family protein